MDDFGRDRPSGGGGGGGGGGGPPQKGVRDNTVYERGQGGFGVNRRGLPKSMSGPAAEFMPPRECVS